VTVAVQTGDASPPGPPDLPVAVETAPWSEHPHVWSEHPRAAPPVPAGPRPGAAVGGTGRTGADRAYVAGVADRAGVADGGHREPLDGNTPGARLAARHRSSP